MYKTSILAWLEDEIDDEYAVYAQPVRWYHVLVT